MDTETYDLYFHTLQDNVYDEEKIVTYKSLSAELGIPIDVSKELLSRFYNDQEKVKPGTLTATFLLYGKLNDGGYSFVLAKDSALENAREQFENIVDEMVYSIQKKADNIDLDALSLVDKDESLKSSGNSGDLGSVTYVRSIEKTDVNRPKPVVKEKKVENETKQQVIEKKSGVVNMFQNKTKRNIQKDFDEAVQNGSSSTITSQEKQVGNETKSQVSKKKSGSLTNMFQNQSEKNSEQSVQSDSNSTATKQEKQVENETKSQVSKKKSGSLTNMFQNQAEKNSERTVQSDSNSSATKQEKQIKNETEPQVTKKKSGSLTNMFKNQAEKNFQTDSKEVSQTNSSSTTTKQTGKQVKAAKASQGGIASFFSRKPSNGSSSNSQKSSITEQEKEKHTINNSKDKETNDTRNEKTSTNKSQERDSQNSKRSYLDLIDEDDDEFMQVEIDGATKAPPVAEKKGAKRAKKDKKQTNKRTRSDDSKEQTSTKKHKRIKVYCSDSSDDDIFASNDRSPSPQVPSEPEDDVLVPATPEVTASLNTRRVRKVKEKTYKDEEGFMVTKKEVVYETASEDESEKEKGDEKTNELVKKESVEKTVAGADKNTKKDKKSKTSPKKQATLMNFFKKS